MAEEAAKRGEASPVPIGGEEAAILARLIKPWKKLPIAAARALSRIDLDENDRRRLHDLAQKNQAGMLTTKEKSELLSYLKN